MALNIVLYSCKSFYFFVGDPVEITILLQPLVTLHFEYCHFPFHPLTAITFHLHIKERSIRMLVNKRRSTNFYLQHRSLYCYLLQSYLNKFFIIIYLKFGSIDIILYFLLLSKLFSHPRIIVCRSGVSFHINHRPCIDGYEVAVFRLCIIDPVDILLLYYAHKFFIVILIIKFHNSASA